MKDTKDINQTILEAMQQDSKEDTVSEEQANALQLIGKSFKGTFRITAIVVVCLQLIFVGLGIYSTIELFAEIDSAIKLHWLLGALVSFIAFAVARLWMFMELNRLSVLREIKRVELQVALLSTLKKT